MEYALLLRDQLLLVERTVWLRRQWRAVRRRAHAHELWTKPARRFRSLLKEELMIFIALAVMVLIISIFMFVQKVRLKSKMEDGLGRKVKNSELTSLSAWMDVPSSQGSGGSSQKPNSR